MISEAESNCLSMIIVGHIGWLVIPRCQQTARGLSDSLSRPLNDSPPPPPPTSSLFRLPRRPQPLDDLTPRKQTDHSVCVCVCVCVCVRACVRVTTAKLISHGPVTAAASCRLPREQRSADDRKTFSVTLHYKSQTPNLAFAGWVAFLQEDWLK